MRHEPISDNEAQWDGSPSGSVQSGRQLKEHFVKFPCAIDPFVIDGSMLVRSVPSVLRRRHTFIRWTLASCYKSSENIRVGDGCPSGREHIAPRGSSTGLPRKWSGDSQPNVIGKRYHLR